MNTLGAQLRTAAASLPASSSAHLDAEILLAHVLGRSRTSLRAHLDEALPAAQAAAYATLVQQRALGVPIAYLTGTQEFWSLALRVTRDTLIPRPDTECLVEAALRALPIHAETAVADLGTGTGAIAIAIAHERPRARVIATERSPGALGVARENVARLAPGRVELRAAHTDWFAALGGERFDVLVSNPPYVAHDDPHLTQDGVRFEPRSALTAGPEGLDDLRAIVSGAAVHLRPGGWLLVEHGYDQRGAVQALFQGAGFDDIDTLEDLGGQPRVSRGRTAIA